MIITSGFSVDLSDVTGHEPVTLQLLKEFLVIDFDDWNTVLDVILSAAREEVEKYTNLSLIQRNVTARWECATTVSLPYGPVVEITSIKDTEDTDLEYSPEGLDFPSYKLERYYPTVIKYKAGYAVSKVPKGLQLAIIKCASDHYTADTGKVLDSKMALPDDWRSLARKYSKRSWLE